MFEVYKLLITIRRMQLPDNYDLTAKDRQTREEYIRFHMGRCGINIKFTGVYPKQKHGEFVG